MGAGRVGGWCEARAALSRRDDTCVRECTSLLIVVAIRFVGRPGGVAEILLPLAQPERLVLRVRVGRGRRCRTAGAGAATAGAGVGAARGASTAADAFSAALPSSHWRSASSSVVAGGPPKTPARAAAARGPPRRRPPAATRRARARTRGRAAVRRRARRPILWSAPRRSTDFSRSAASVSMISDRGGRACLPAAAPPSTGTHRPTGRSFWPERLARGGYDPSSASRAPPRRPRGTEFCAESRASGGAFTFTAIEVASPTR